MSAITTDHPFLCKHAERITGVRQCFDRLILRGHLPMAGPGYFSTWLYSKQTSLNLQAPPEGWWNFKEAAPWFSGKLEGLAMQSALRARAGQARKHLRAE